MGVWQDKIAQHIKELRELGHQSPPPSAEHLAARTADILELLLAEQEMLEQRLVQRIDNGVSTHRGM